MMSRIRLMAKALVAFLWGLACSAGSAVRSPRQSTEKAVTGANAIRTLGAPIWRKVVRYAVVVVGFGLFVACELGVAFLINAWWWYYVILGILCGVCMAAALSRPLLAMLVWLALYPWVQRFIPVRFPFYLKFDLLTIVFLSAVVIPRTLANRVKPRKLHSAEWLLLLSFLYCAVLPIVQDILRTRLRLYDLELMLRLAMNPVWVYFLVRSLMSSRRQVNTVLVAVVVVGVLWTVSAFYEHFTGFRWFSVLIGQHVPLEFNDVGKGRAIGPTDAQVVPGTVLSATVLVALHLSASARTAIRRLAYSVLAGAMIVAVFFTYTRTSYGAFAVSILAMLILAKGRRVQYGVVVACMGVALLIALPKLLSSNDFYERMTGAQNYYGRTAMIQTGINIVKDNFWWGVGDVGDQKVLAKYISSRKHPRVGRERLLEVVESDYLLILGNYGIFGFLLHFGALGMFFMHMFRVRKSLPAWGALGSNLPVVAVAYSLVMYVSMTVTQLYLSPYLYYLLFVLFAAAVRAGEIAEEEKALEKVPAQGMDDAKICAMVTR